MFSFTVTLNRAIGELSNRNEFNHSKYRSNQLFKREWPRPCTICDVITFDGQLMQEGKREKSSKAK